MTCPHAKGDFFNGVWVCSQCYKQLHERPRRYVSGWADGIGKYPQDVIVAEIATFQSRPFSDFLGWMVRYLRMRSVWTITRSEALRQCLDVLSDMGEPYGSSGACWSKVDAKDLVREGIICYWDEGVGGANK